jgi:hypothetical protein
MKQALVILVMLIASHVASAEVAFQSLEDQQHGFVLRYPKKWRVWRDSDDKCHLTLRSTDDHMMVFVMSEVFEPALLPAHDESLSEWGRRTFVREDPKVTVKSVVVDHSLFAPCAFVSLEMRQDDGTKLKSETYAFTCYPSDESRRRVWKVFAIFEPASVTAEELAGWAEIKSSLRITGF